MGIQVLLIFEVLGRPPEHIKDALEKVVDRLGEISGVDIIKKKFHEPKPVDDEKAKDKSLYTSFAEVETNIETLDLVFRIVVKMLPAHVEILEPEELRMRNFDLNNVLGELALNIHRYDDIAKAVMIERSKMIENVKKMEAKIKELGGDLDFLKPENKKEETPQKRNVEEIKEEEDSKNKEKKEKDSENK